MSWPVPARFSSACTQFLQARFFADEATALKQMENTRVGCAKTSGRFTHSVMSFSKSDRGFHIPFLFKQYESQEMLAFLVIR